MKRIDAFALAVLGLLAAGLTVTARSTRTTAQNVQTQNHLKIIGLAFHNYHDANGIFAFNGGADDAASLKANNYGWHRHDVRDSGTWATQILPYIEQEPLWKAAEFTGVEPPELPKYPDDKIWQVSVKEYLLAGRGRHGFKTNSEKGNFPGPVTDFALNIFLNARPDGYDANGYAIAPGSSGDWAAGNNKSRFAAVSDGLSNTILVGGKALPPQVKAATKDCDDSECAPVPAAANGDAAKNGDEGIFSPGNWKLEDKGKKLISSGTGRGHIVVKAPPNEPKENPKDGGVPWIYKDSELAGKDATDLWPTAWGGSFEDGLLVVICDGSVRTVKYSQKGTVNFARMLYPADGGVVNFD